MRPAQTFARRALALATALSLLAALAPGARALGPEPGDAAPELQAKDWVGTPVAPHLNRDAVLIVIFFQTSAPDMVRYMGEYVKLLERYGDRGLKVCGISRESKDILLNWGEEYGIKFPLGVDAGSWKGNYGVDAYPYAYVIDIYGEVAYKGDANRIESVIPPVDMCLKEIKRIELKRADTSKAFDKIWRAVDKGDYTQVLKFTDAIAKGTAQGEAADKDRAHAEAIRKDIETMAEARWKRAQALEKRMDYVSAEQILKTLEKGFTGTPQSKLAKDRLAEWEKDEILKDELTAQRYYEQGRKLEDAKKYKEADECYRAAMSKAHTRAAKKALGRHGELVKKGFVKQ